MPKLVWNGGLQLDIKAIGVILWCTFITGGGWYKLEAIESAFHEHVAQSQIKSDQLTVMGIRMDTMETRVDGCCPYTHATLTVPSHTPILRGRVDSSLLLGAP